MPSISTISAASFIFNHAMLVVLQWNYAYRKGYPYYKLDVVTIHIIYIKQIAM